jgi:MPBQ/MSBQ methyltransferase
MFVGIIPVVVSLMTCYLWEGIAKSAGLVRFCISGFIKFLPEIPTLLLMRLVWGAGFGGFGMFRALAANSLAELTETSSTKIMTGV